MSVIVTLHPDVERPPPGAGPLYEVIDGRVVEPPEMSAFETMHANLILRTITLFFAQDGPPGQAVLEMLFRLDPESRRMRRPDLAFVSYERWPRDRDLPFTEAWNVVPDLAVEVISPNELAIEVLEKIDDYFRAGVRQVWVIYPRHSRVFVHNGPKSITVLDAADVLDGGDVLPGFQLRLAELFRKASMTES